jgi:hypothetical protein
MPHFECGAFNHSATSPDDAQGRGRVLGEDGGPDKAPARRIIVNARISAEAGQVRGRQTRKKTGGPASLHENDRPEVRLRWPVRATD